MRRALRTLLFLCVLGTGVLAQGQTDLAKAQAHVSAGRFPEAETLLAALVEREPTNARGWYLLGYARHAQGRMEQALLAHEKAAGFPQTKINALYNAACANARLGRTEAAFEKLAAAKQAGFSNPTLLASDTDLDSLRNDPRFQTYAPAGSGADPTFVEEVRVLFEWRGEAANDQFGWEARNTGDVDGDGVDDALVSAPYKSIGGPNAGRIYVYSGKTGKELFRRDGKPGDFLGIGISPAGDVNADGKDDVLVGAWGSGNAAGKALVLDGTGAVLHELCLEESGDRLGWKVAPAGDSDGDGHDDVLVGAPQAAGGKGRAYLFSGKTGELLAALEGERAGDGFGGCVAGAVTDGSALICVGAGNAGPGNRGRAYVYAFAGGTAEPRFTVDPEATGKNLGRMFLSFPGDLNADGTLDLYVSDWEGGPNGVGRAYLHSGKTGERLYALAGQAAGEGFGIGTAEAGDVDHDGHDDLIIGAWQNSVGAPSAGRVSLFSGKDGSLLRHYTGTNAGDTFGFDATTLGDVNGDGANDFLITSAYSGVNGFRSGRVLVLAGD